MDGRASRLVMANTPAVCSGGIPGMREARKQPRRPMIAAGQVARRSTSEGVDLSFSVLGLRSQALREEGGEGEQQIDQNDEVSECRTNQREVAGVLRRKRNDAMQGNVPCTPKKNINARRRSIPISSIDLG